MTVTPLFAQVLLGCTQPEPLGDSVHEPVSSADQPFSPAGIERVIPLRIIQTMHFAAPADQRALYERMQRQVQSANSVYHNAGVQFHIKVFKECSSTGLLVNQETTTRYLWSDLKLDLWCAIPGANGVNDPLPGQLKTPGQWAAWTTMEYGDQSELVVWLRDDGGGHCAQGPWAGNSIHFQQFEANPAKLPHELIHSLGLPHTFGVTSFVGTTWLKDPETGANFQYRDFWDLVYTPGLPTNTYYSSRASVPDAGLLNVDNGQCSWDNHHQIDCALYQGTAYGSPVFDFVHWPCTDPLCALKGLGFTFTTDDNPPASYKYGGNVASYLHDGYQVGLSDSLINVVRKFLRYDTVIATDESGQDHVGDINRTSSRGQWLNRQPTYVLDFDHDGKRDFGWWEQPTAAGVNGTFRVVLSNGGTMNVPFGQLGDIPVPADYNGDGYTDIAVFQPGGGYNRQDPLSTAAYWGYCATNTQNPAGTTCQYPVWYQFGEREDVPLPGLDFDGLGSTGHLAIFRPSSHVWVWGPVANYDPGTARVVYLGDATTRAPLPGRYDHDGMTDIAAYDTSTGKFHIKTSSSNWLTAIVRQFPVPQYTDSGAPMPRAVPVPGMMSHVYYRGSYQPRNGIALWWPDIGYWNVMWNPAFNNAYSACQAGQSGDVPIGGIGSDDRNLSQASYSRMTFYRSAGYYGPGTLTFRELNDLSCGAWNPSPVTLALAHPHTLTYSVGDMTGDHLPEILMINQNDASTVYYLKSNDNYQYPYSITVPVPPGSAGAHMFVIL